jgi:hypothetical protein
MVARHYQIGGLKVPKSEISKVHDHIMVVHHGKTFTGHRKERKKEREIDSYTYFRVKTETFASRPSKSKASSHIGEDVPISTTCQTARTTREKYFDYFVSTSSTAASTAACHARGLAAAHSRKLSAALGDSTSTRP